MGDSLPIRSKNGIQTVRFLTFNVNGIRTFFHYHPFSEMNQSLNKVFDYFESDIISFQELKIDKTSVSKWGKVAGFNSFISVPLTKKGYSGVGCWVRNYPQEHPLHESLKVLKAEEGITGMMAIKIGKKNIRYRDDLTIGIGGYESLGIDEDDEKEGLRLDSEGRCVIIELACNIVVISVYCPANSNLSDEGGSQRLKFLSVLFKRIRNIDKMGKKVVLMGDINVCRDLCDHAESLENAAIPINDQLDGASLEQKYRKLCETFVLDPETPHRRMFNKLLSDSIIPEFAKEGILVDTTRLIQTKKRLKMYTVWNTLKNTRPVNYGSRIDFILTGLPLQHQIETADILPQVVGSDHCPVFADLNFQSFNHDIQQLVVKLPKFEARHKYGLLHGNILEMFSRNEKTATTKTVMKKGQITKKTPPKELNSNDMKEALLISERAGKGKAIGVGSDSANVFINDLLGKPPLCKHGMEAMLRTSKTAANPGKKFWICKLPKGSSEDYTASCGFFQWV